jgi:hypothetical protein
MLQVTQGAVPNSRIAHTTTTTTTTVFLFHDLIVISFRHACLVTPEVEVIVRVFDCNFNFPARGW